MSDKKFQTIIDFGFSKIRAGAFNEEGKNNPFFIESNFYTDQFNLQIRYSKNCYITRKNPQTNILII